MAQYPYFPRAGAYNPQGYYTAPELSSPALKLQPTLDPRLSSNPLQLADEATIVLALVQARSSLEPKIESMKVTLDRLNGRSGHLAKDWKDYYLEHHERIEDKAKKQLLAMKGQHPPSPNTSRARSISSSLAPTAGLDLALQSAGTPLATMAAQVIIEPMGTGSILSQVHSRVTPPSRSPKAKPRSSPAVQTSGAARGSRKTINSMTTHQPAYTSSLPPPNNLIEIPVTPSQEPSPPTEVVPLHGRNGNMYTIADKRYFIEFILWKLDSDPNLTRADLCQLLADNVPHHSVSSWRGYWSNHHDLPDIIVSRAHNKPITARKPIYPHYESDECGDSDSESETEDPARLKSEEEDFKGNLADLQLLVSSAVQT
ncbi:hypothetical protein C8R43DRAFT_951581 [Mycena crocata]|nr:hypothetical protein C8R43DRAFT_951581 [Mycena crocata]